MICSDMGSNFSEGYSFLISVLFEEGDEGLLDVIKIFLHDKKIKR